MTIKEKTRMRDLESENARLKAELAEMKQTFEEIDTETTTEAEERRLRGAAA